MNGAEDKLFAQIAAKKNFKSGPGASADEIDAAQDALGLEFPWEYRAFLAQFSYASWFGHFVTGIVDHDTYGVVSHTEFEREAGRCPDSAIVLDTDFLMYCRDPDEPFIKGAGESFRDFRSWLSYKVS